MREALQLRLEVNRTVPNNFKQEDLEVDQRRLELLTKYIDLLNKIPPESISPIDSSEHSDDDVNDTLTISV